MNALRKKTIIKTTGFLIVLWILLFVPAGSINYWQGWIFWSVFSLAVIAVTVYFLEKDPKLMESRLDAGPAAEKEKNQKIIQLFSSVSWLFVLIVPGLDYRFRWSTVPVPLVIFADVCVIIGFWIVFLVFKENSYASAIIKVRKEQKVISTGPYTIIRHPMYAGAALLVGVMPFALGSWWAFPFVLLMGIGVILRLLQEEKYLSENLPGYNEYCKKTGYRLIPFIW
jgi:protein-S-isoprenylcysteine O-methyltransferase Ste14